MKRSISMRLIGLTALTVLVVSVIAACAPAAAPAPTSAPPTSAPAQATAAPAPTQAAAATAAPVASGRGSCGTLKLLWWQAPTILNPHLAQGTKDYDASRLVYLPLASVGPDGLPDAATGL